MIALALLLCAGAPVETLASGRVADVVAELPAGDPLRSQLVAFLEQMKLTRDPAAAVRRAFGWGWAASQERNTIVALLAGTDADFHRTLSALSHAVLPESHAGDCSLPRSPRVALPAGAVDDGPRDWQLACTIDAKLSSKFSIMSLYVVSYSLKLTSPDGVVRESLDGTQPLDGISRENALMRFRVRASPRLTQAIVDHMLDEAEDRLNKVDDAQRTPIDL